MDQYQGHQQDERSNENQQLSQQQGYDNEPDQNQCGQTRQQQRGDEDNDDINHEGNYGTEYANNANLGDQPQDDGKTASQQSDKKENTENTNQDNDNRVNKETASHQLDKKEDSGTPSQDNNNRDDGQKAPQSSDVNITFNINLVGDLEKSSLHEGGIMFSKKLLAQLFSRPGEHDPQEEEVPMHRIQHEHVDTAAFGEWTVVQLKAKDAKGATIYVKAKLDCAADANFMSSVIAEVTEK